VTDQARKDYLKNILRLQFYERDSARKIFGECFYKVSASAILCNVYCILYCILCIVLYLVYCDQCIGTRKFQNLFFSIISIFGPLKLHIRKYNLREKDWIMSE
jgi:hypothetical protein